MTKRIFVTATNTNIGKTYTTKLLLKEFASRGFRVGAIKPIETGVVDGYAPDGEELLSTCKELNDKFLSLRVENLVSIVYTLPAAPFISSNNTPLDFKKIDKDIEAMEKICDILIIEGAGGLLVPVDSKTMMVDLIEYFDAKALLVTHCSLGCINDTLLSKKLLEDRGIPHIVAFNSREGDDGFTEVSEPYFLYAGYNIMKVKQDIDKICDALLL